MTEDRPSVWRKRGFGEPCLNTAAVAFTRALGWVTLLALSAGLWGACARHDSSRQNIEAKVAGQPIFARVVDDIVARKHISRDEAIEFAADQLRLSLAYREEHQSEGSAFRLEPEIERYLKQKKRVRLWLKEKFETSHRAQEIPRSVVDKNLEDPKIRNQHFHPRLHGYCQVVVVWKDSDKNNKEKKDAASPRPPDFETRARALVAPFWRALQQNRPEMQTAENCDRFDRLAKFIDRKREPDFEIRVERSLLDLSHPRWDEDFRRAVSPVETPQLLPPFMTQFGLHVVEVLEVMPARLPDNSLPATKLRRERERWLRQEMAPAYLRSAMGELLERLRKEKYLRFYTREGQAGSGA